MHRGVIDTAHTRFGKAQKYAIIQRKTRAQTSTPNQNRDLTYFQLWHTQRSKEFTIPTIAYPHRDLHPPLSNRNLDRIRFTQITQVALIRSAMGYGKSTLFVYHIRNQKRKACRTTLRKKNSTSY